jgi:NADH-quinone oxidoreductase subunit G
MHFPKRTFDKPIPISPLIALDRERCILCYRCTRFSENVSEDGQLVAVNRGASSVIATFEDEPYRAHFSGNVVELCPVGALTSTTYRFRARPWEIQNVPVRSAQAATSAPRREEGAGCRVTIRGRQGWMRQGFSYSHRRSRSRTRPPADGVGSRNLWEDALGEVRSLRGGRTPSSLLSGQRRSRSRRRAVRQARLRHCAAGARDPPTPSAPLSSMGPVVVAS